MDPLKKLVADRLKTEAVVLSHPEAEALSAFAENALAPAERQTVMAHLATCADCREALFLSAPQGVEMQEVVSAPKQRFRFALRWGTLAACVVIAAAVLVTRRESTRTMQLAKSSGPEGYVTPAAPAAAQNTIAADKAPAELDAMRDRGKELVPRASAPAPIVSGYAEPKDATAKPKAVLDFEKSGEVRLDESKTLNGREEPQPVQDLPVTGRNVTELAKVAPGAASSASASGAGTGRAMAALIGGTANSYGYTASNAPVQAKKETAFHGSVAGTVSDVSGAVVANVKVTAAGPLGERTTVSDASGKFFFDGLAPGSYSFKADAPGFRTTEVTQVAVLADRPASMDFKLQPGLMAETVTVEAAASPVAAPAVSAPAQVSSVVADEKGSFDSLQTAQARMQTTRETTELKQKAVPLRKASRADQAAWASPAWQWSLSSQGGVQRSNDSGKSWQPVSIASGVVFRAVASLATHVWAGGNGGVLYRSADSGQRWAQVVPAANGEKLQADIAQIQLTDPQHASITTSDKQVWTTTDGGQTWSRK